jgi:hypothetical protein
LNIGELKSYGFYGSKDLTVVHDANLLGKMHPIRDEILSEAPYLSASIHFVDDNNHTHVKKEKNHPNICSADMEEKSKNCSIKYGNRDILGPFQGELSFTVWKQNSSISFHQTSHYWSDLLLGQQVWVIFPPGAMPSTYSFHHDIIAIHIYI